MLNASDYLKNPTGKGNAIMQIGLVSKALDNDFMVLNQKMNHTWWITIDKTKAIAHIKVPSRKIDDLFYDVLLEFDITGAGNYTSVSSLPMRVFSNCPSFTFTYAYVFAKNGDIIDWCKSKYTKKVIKKRPEERNPYELVSYERSIYLAIKYILSQRRHFVGEIRRTGKRLPKRDYLLRELKTSDEILDLYDEGRVKIRKEKEKETKKTQKPSVKKEEHKKKSSGSVKSIRSVSRSKKTKKMKKI